MPTATGPKLGRVWERNEPPPLHFSGHTMQLLRWLLVEPLETLRLHCRHRAYLVRRAASRA